MTKYINTSGHRGPEWVLSSYGIVERVKELLGGIVEVYGVSTSQSNIPMTVEISTSEGVFSLRLQELDAGRVEQQIRDLLPPLGGE